MKIRPTSPQIRFSTGALVGAKDQGGVRDSGKKRERGSQTSGQRRGLRWMPM
jgi:hypothetical protein